MKKFFVLLFVVAIAITFVSCQKQTTTVEKVTKTTVKEIGTEGFLFKKVIKGDTIWGYSEEVYGNGIPWREIVAENPFLADRVSYDSKRGQWIVKIYEERGEIVKIRIRGKSITPTFTSEETTITTTTENAGIPWWGWLLIAVGSAVCLFFIFGMIGLTSYHKCYRPQNCFPTPIIIGRSSVDYHATANGDKRVHLEWVRETTITHSANGELKINARQ